ncbi:nucleotide pyrophosphohydrolase [Actinomycetospora callitridis]|uniref:nucleotide pyrophosphohydrolase n=1 Tax=Actinomycetospora callitridis TaxID=913944 RepID=UPI002365DD06|nr:nucleotide pyrophosphohydrolase [Actinomycetospora callitridis]MDD7920976.1 nucleotide pyrophosphohydrolase [Actinomycetospora callitridis]
MALNWPEATQRRLRAFAETRDWVRYHDPRSLLLALVGEVGELAELYQWQTDEPPDQARVQDEIADVLIYALRFAEVAGVDVAAAVAEKIDRNEQRFPALPLEEGQ